MSWVTDYGRAATIEISIVPAFGAWPDVGQLVAKDWEKVGIKAIVQIRERALHFKMRDANELMAEIWNQDTSGFPFTGNTKYDVRIPAIQIGNFGPLLPDTLQLLLRRQLVLRRRVQKEADEYANNNLSAMVVRELAKFGVTS